MDLATLLGVLAGFGLIIGAMILGGSPGSFVDAPSVLIVIGGTIASAMIAQTPKQLIGAFKIGLQTFFDRTPSVVETSQALQEIAAKVRKEGLLAVESYQANYAFLGRALRLAVDGVAPDTIRETLTSEMSGLRQRHQAGQAVFKFMGGAAPAMGMIGTLIGLVQMLKTLDDPSSIGPSMAVALLTTLYGALLANILFLPMAEKLQARTKAETLAMVMVIDGMDSIARGENPIIMRERISAHLAPALRSNDEAA